MTNFFNKFKIPTVLGLGILAAGIAAGLVLNLKTLTFFSQASPNQTPQNITFSNTEDSSISISWTTSAKMASLVSYAVNSTQEQTSIDDRDNKTPKPRLTHHVTLKNLLPQTSYQFKIISGNASSETVKFTTAYPASSQNGLKPIAGSVLENNRPPNEGIAYLNIANATIQSAPVKNLGSFLIPVSQMRKQDLSQVFVPDEEVVAKLVVITDTGSGSATFRLNAPQLNKPLQIGQDLDFTAPEQAPAQSASTPELQKYDLNGDGSVNSSDYAIVLKNFGKNPQNKKADLNGDGVVDQKDVDLISKYVSKPAE